jgi:eukaryotic-like serine/threonine-protein kinase
MDDSIIKFIRQNDFELIKHIGRGACGTTVLLKDNLLDQYFVCKKYQPFTGIEPKQYFENFITEIKLMHQINNRNVIRIYNYFLYPSLFTGFILMEYIDGYSFDTFIHENPEKINDLFIQAIQGFSGLEDSGILHRDIRSSNILISKDNVLKIIDLGFGKKINFESDFQKSISLTYWCDTPNEFNDKIYNFQTEIYFLGKLFEKAIQDNDIQEFAYITELKNMILKDPATRYTSFKNIFNTIITKQNIEDLFDQHEIETYRTFANNLSSYFSQISSSATYEDDIDLLISKLDDVYHKNMLEDNIQSVVELGRALVKGSYKYKKNYYFEVFSLKDFLNLIKMSSTDKKRIILLHLQNRFNSIPHYNESDFDDDIPF